MKPSRRRPCATYLQACYQVSERSLAEPGGLERESLLGLSLASRRGSGSAASTQSSTAEPRHRGGERFRSTAPNQVWGLDFIADQLVDGRAFRALTVVDIYTRESLAIGTGESLKGGDVVMVLNRFVQRGAPKVLL